MTFKTQIKLVGVAALIVTILAGAYIIKETRSLSTTFNELSEIDGRVRLLFEIKQNLADFERGQKSYLLTSDDLYLEPYSKAEANFNLKIDELKMIVKDKTYLEGIEQIISIKDNWIKSNSIPQMMALKKLNRGLISSQQFTETLKNFNDMKVFNELHVQLESYLSAEREKSQLISSNAKSKIGQLIIFSILNMIIFLASLALTIFMSTKATLMIQNFIENLKKVLGNTLQNSHTLGESGTQLRKIIDGQNQAINSTTSAGHQLSELMKESLQQIEQTDLLTQKGAKAASEGYNVGKELIDVLKKLENSIRDQLESITKSLNKIDSFKEKISGIQDNTKLIFDLVFQTKLLSFNASVEAARAGESGKGFAVVAEEVSKLAAQSGQTANKIDDSVAFALSEIQQITENNKVIIADIKNQLKISIEEVLSFGDKNQQAFKILLENAETNTQIFKQITHSSKEQTSGVIAIKDNILTIDGLATESKSASESTFQVINSLNKDITTLKNAIEDLSKSFVSQDNTIKAA